MNKLCPKPRGQSSIFLPERLCRTKRGTTPFRVRDTEVDEREAPIRAATVRERLPATRLDLTPPVVRGSDWSTPYARVLSIGACFDESFHFHVALPPFHGKTFPVHYVICR